MTYADVADWSTPLRVTRKPARNAHPRDIAGAVALVFTVSLGGWLLATGGAADRIQADLPSLPVPTAILAKTRIALDPFLSMNAPAMALADSVPLAARFVMASGPSPTSVASLDDPAAMPAQPSSPVVAMADPAPPVATADAAPAAVGLSTDIPVPPMPLVVEREGVVAAAADTSIVPLPLPRPPELRAVAAAQTPVPQVAAAPMPRSPSRVALSRAPATAAAAPADNRTFLQRLFGAQPGGDQPTNGAALAYAAPESNLLGNMFRGGGNPLTLYDRYTAVYDISAHTVYLPNGNRLEAHSGLGDLIDDPRHVSTRNRGATPPHMYDLSLRESLFHGVQALRLKPVGEGTVYGRDGLLAHTFMLGPNGDSNGCVSFRNYHDFLGAFQRGEVRRLAVVARLS